VDKTTRLLLFFLEMVLAIYRLAILQSKEKSI